jgi:hypothetical protein
MKTKQLQLRINGVMTTVTLPNGLKPAHGPGIDGKTKVESLLIGTSPEYPGKVFIQDAGGNNSMTDADELFVASQHAATLQKKGFKITSTKIAS